MPDMLVKLLDLPPLAEATVALERDGIRIRRALVIEKPLVREWVDAYWPAWTAEVEATFARLPVSCFLAHSGNELLGFACYDGVCRNFFGPTAVIDGVRGRGIGRALLLAALHAQRAQGYAYAIIGGVGPIEYYAKTVGAVPIEGSGAGVYAGRLRGGAPN